MKVILKILSINLLILISLLVFVDFISITILEINFLSRKKENKSIQYSQLPVYNNVLWADLHFKEYDSISADYKSYFEWRHSYFSGKTINIDSAGIRRTIQYSNISKNTKSVFFLGGSTMWGTGSNDSCTIPSFFCRISNGSFTASNFGELDYKAYQGFQFLQIQLIKGFIPDIVVSYDGVNNSPVYNNFFSSNREKQISETMSGADEEKDNIRFFDYYLKPTRILLNKSKLKIKGYLQNNSNIVDLYPTSNHINDSLAAVELLESWLCVKRVSEAYGAKFLCILQPVAFYGKPKTKYLKDLNKFSYFTYTYYDFVLKLLETRKYKNLKSNFLNLSNAFDNIDNLYIDRCHVGPKGNSIIANHIFNKLNFY